MVLSGRSTLLYLNATTCQAKIGHFRGGEILRCYLTLDYQQSIFPDVLVRNAKHMLIFWVRILKPIISRAIDMKEKRQVELLRYSVDLGKRT